METTYTHAKKTVDFINKQMDKKGLNNLLSQCILSLAEQKPQNWLTALKISATGMLQNPEQLFLLQTYKFRQLKRVATRS